MFMCNQVMLNKTGALTPPRGAVAALPNRFVGAIIIKTLKAALVWPAWAQSERK
jgi:hypothetical protein